MRAIALGGPKPAPKPKPKPRRPRTPRTRPEPKPNAPLSTRVRQMKALFEQPYTGHSGFFSGTIRPRATRLVLGRAEQAEFLEAALTDPGITYMAQCVSDAVGSQRVTWFGMVVNFCADASHLEVS